MKKKGVAKKSGLSKMMKLGAYTLALCAWVYLAFLGAQWVVAQLALLVFGIEVLRTPLGMGLLMFVGYAVTIAATILLPVLAWRAVQGSKSKKKWVQVVRTATSREQLGLNNLPTWTDIGLGVAGMLVYLLVGGIVMQLVSQIPGFDAGQTQELGFAKYLVGFDLVVALFALAIVAPVAEEIIFRGYLYGKLREKLTGTWGMIISMVVVSALFGALHGQWNVGVNVFVLSLVMCSIREMTGTIWGAIILHIIKNALACYAVFVLGMA